MSTKPNKRQSGRARAAEARKAAAETKRFAEKQPGEAVPAPFEPSGRPSDVFGGELRRRDVFSLLVLHMICRSESGASYGNQLIDQIGELTRGVVSLNPNTMYPLLRELETRGTVEGKWEHPQKRSRRLYTVTDAGKDEYERLKGGLEPFLDSIMDGIALIKAEVYGDRGKNSARRPPRDANG